MAIVTPLKLDADAWDSHGCNSTEVGVPQLAAAVYEAGALGILMALTQPDPAALRVAIRETSPVDVKPFGVNITLLPNISLPDHRAAVEEGVDIFETAGNNPGPLITYLKSQGCFVLHKRTTIRHARSSETCRHVEC